MAEGAHRPAWVEVDLAAIEHNARVLQAIAAPARLCAVVKADAYGHGAVEVAKAALRGGASELAVAIVDEGAELRDGGVEAPVLVLGEPGPDAMAEVYAYGLTPTVYSLDGVALASKAASGSVRGATGPAPVEVKLDSGMHRVGASPGEVGAVVAAVVERPELGYAGLWTHLAVADEPESRFTSEQLACFEGARAELRSAGLPEPRRLHAANTAGTIGWPAARYDLVRCGIGLYGYCPSAAMAPALAAAVEAAGIGGGREGLRPALSLHARVSLVRDLPAGERVSYGLARALPEASRVATVPLGYADGIPRAYFEHGGTVLVNGRRRPLAGVVTMDQIVVDCGEDRSVERGDEVVLIGAQAEGRITAEDWAFVLGTVSYEVVTRIGPRVPRIYRSPGDREPAR